MSFVLRPSSFFSTGCKLTKSKRRLLRVKSPIYYHSVTFLEQVARGVALQGSVDEEENEEEEEDEKTI
jgi:hypothetical protein